MIDDKARRIPDHIEHIIAAISKIERYAQGLDWNGFLENDMAQDAIIRKLEIIGEAARRIMSADPEFTSTHPALELDAAYRMRNALAHGYETVNLRTVWNTVEQKLPALKAEAITVLKGLAS